MKMQLSFSRTLRVALAAGLVGIISLATATQASAAGCLSGSLIKGSGKAVYYCGADGKRYVFTSQKEFGTWYSDFSQVTTISDSDMASIRIGGIVTYRPGVRLVKLQTSNVVYAVAKGGTLRPIADAKTAACLYGVGWNKMVDDIPDANFTNYSVGSELASCWDYNRSTEIEGTVTINATKNLNQVSIVAAPSSQSTSNTGPYCASASGGCAGFIARIEDIPYLLTTTYTKVFYLTVKNNYISGYVNSRNLDTGEERFVANILKHSYDPSTGKVDVQYSGPAICASSCWSDGFLKGTITGSSFSSDQGSYSLTYPPITVDDLIPNASCLIKGYKYDSAMTYYLTTSTVYSTIMNVDEWFCSEDAAIRAGYKKSLR